MLDSILLLKLSMGLTTKACIHIHFFCYSYSPERYNKNFYIRNCSNETSQEHMQLLSQLHYRCIRVFELCITVTLCGSCSNFTMHCTNVSVIGRVANYVLENDCYYYDYRVV